MSLSSVPSPGYNAVLRLDHFLDPGFGHDCRRIFRHLDLCYQNFPHGHENAKIWETVQAWRAFRDFDILGNDRSVIGIGAGAEPLSFFLTNHVGQVHATDLYASKSDWTESGVGDMLVEPLAHLPPLMPFRRRRLVVQHMDALDLRYENESFDGVFSCGSIEHFGSLDNVAAAAREIARVLKPGGLVAISTEFRLKGGGADGIEGSILFTRELLQKYIVDASGLTMVDDLQTETDVLPTCYPLLDAVMHGTRPRSLCVSHAGFEWTSVSLCLQKQLPRSRPGPRKEP